MHFRVFDIYSYQHSFYLQSSFGLYFSFGFENNPIDANSVYLEFYTVTYNSTQNKTTYDLVDFKYCTESMYPSNMRTMLKKFKFYDTYLCPNMTNVFLNSNSDSFSSYKFFQVDAVVCQSSGSGST